jgi:hypothetical protein
MVEYGHQYGANSVPRVIKKIKNKQGLMKEIEIFACGRAGWPPD